VSKTRVLMLCALALSCALGFSGCSGSSTIAITLSPTTAPTLNPGQTQAITATVTNDKNKQGVTWSLSGVGTLTSQTTTSVTYVAPSSIPAATSVTITATSVANTSITATLTISLNAVFAFSTTSLPAGTVNVPYSGVISVTGSTGPFTWAITTGTLPPGLTLSSSTAASISVTGTPSIVGTSNFTIQCTDSAGNAITESLSITIEVPPPLSVGTKSLPNGTVGIAYFPTKGFQLLASSGTPPYTWALASGSGPLPPGLSLTSDGFIQGTPTTAGIYSFTVQVTDSTTPNPQVATGNLSLTVVASTVDSVLQGTYAFQLSGFGPDGHFVAAGSFVSDGQGNITSGTMDSNTPNGQSLGNAFTGTYSIFADDLGSITLGGNESGRIFYIAMQADGTAGKIIETDATGTHASGVLLLQNTADFSASSITGTYSFGFLGTDPSAARYAFGGEVAASNGALNGVADSDDAGTILSNTACTGSYSVATPSTTGRGTGTLTIGGVTTNYAFYIVSSSQLLFMQTDAVPSASLVSGSMLKQGSVALNGTSVFQTTALQTSGGNQTAIGQVGLLGTSSGGALTTNFDQNSGGTMAGPLSNSGTFVVAGSGRATLSGSGLAASDPVLYVVNSNEAFIIGTDANITFGFMENQEVSSTNFSAASLSGVYAGGSVGPSVSAGNNQVDTATADGVQNFNPINTDSSNNGLNQTSSATYSVDTTGRGVLKNGSSAEVGIIYIVSPVGASAPSEYYELYTDLFATVEIFQQ